MIDQTSRSRWQDRAACMGTFDLRFFPERGASNSEIKAICAGCPVREECLEHALTAPEKFGIWGGTSERERGKIRKRRQKEAAGGTAT